MSTYVKKNIIFFASLLLLFAVDYSSVPSYLYTLVLILILNKLFCKKENNNYYYFHGYLAVAIILYIVHKSLMPDYLGLTGPEGGIGTDDCRYYAQILDGPVPYKIRFDILNMMEFSVFLKTLYPFIVLTPLNIVIVNLLGVVFLPYIVRVLSLDFGLDKRIACKAEQLTFLCPYIMYFGCIIMRDMWIATFVVLGIVLFRRKKYLLLLFVVLLTAYIRFGSLIFIGIGIGLCVREKVYLFFKSKSTALICFLGLLMIVVGIFYFTFPILMASSGGKLESGLLRLSFGEILANIDSEATLLKLLFLPFPLNVILLSVFFFFLPFLNFEIYTFGIFNMGCVFNNILTPVFFFPLWHKIIGSVLSFIRTNSFKIQTIVYIAITYSVVLGTVSLQARHKTILMPFLCLLAAIGNCGCGNKYRKTALYSGVGIVIFQVIYSVISF